MAKVLFIGCCLVLFAIYLSVDSKILNIDLIRKKYPRENMMEAKEHGLDFYDIEKPDNRTNFTLALRKYLDNEFYGSVRLGSTGQEFHVIFDTAWTDSWIMSKDCTPQVTGCQGHTLYDHDRSATYVPDGRSYFNSEGTYNFTGYYSYDKINYGGTKIVKQSFIEMTYLPPSYALQKSDGVIGLSLPFNGQKTLPNLLFDAGIIKKPIFSIYLNRDTQSNRAGDITLGAINQKHIHVTNKVKDNITYVAVDDTNGLWSFNMDGVAVFKANTSIPICVHGCKAFVDTGSINIYASKAEVEKINSIIRATPAKDGKFAIECATINKLPPIHFIINGNKFALNGEHYTQKIQNGNQVQCFSVFMAPMTPSENGSWILGASFLSHFFSIYNFQSKTIGFVTAA